MKFTSLKVQHTGDKHFHGNSFLNANKKKISLTIDPNVNLIAMENIEAHVYQGNKMRKGKMQSQKPFF